LAFLPYSWKGSTKGPFSSSAFIGGRGVGHGEEKVSPLRGWGDIPMRDFFEQPQKELSKIPLSFKIK